MLQKLLFRNFRLIYKTSRALRSRFTANGLMVLIAAITAGVFGFDTWQTLSFQIFSLLFCILLIALLCSLFFPNRLTVRRRLPEFATVGQPVKYDLVIDNPDSRNQVDIEVADQLEDSFPQFEEFRREKDPLDLKRNWFDRSIGYPRLMTLIQRRRGGFIQRGDRLSLPARSRQRTSSTLVPVHRGYLDFAAVRLLKPDPLGLVYSVRKIPLHDRLLVFPRYFHLGKIVLPGSRKYQPQGHAMSGSVGDSEEFLALREYRAGDPLKKIHWKSFARLNTPIIKEYHEEYCVRQGLILDTWNNTDNETLFEDAVSAASSFVMSCLQQDSILDLMFVGDKSYRFHAGRGSMTLENMLEILACVQSTHTDNLDALEQMTSRVVHECSVFVCILLGWDERRRNMIRTLRRHGITLLCIVMDTGPDRAHLDTGPLLDQPGFLHEVRQTDFERDLQDVVSGLTRL